MDLSFKCPLCEVYFSTQDDLKEHIKASHTSYYYDTYMVPPLLIFPSESAVITAEASDTVITTEPVLTLMRFYRILYMFHSWIYHIVDSNRGSYD